MNIPADLPSPDQENVYYSVKAMTTEFLKYFPEEKIKILKSKLETYYYPTFVFDDSNVPDTFQISVFPRDAKSEILLLDSNGTVIDSKKPSKISVRKANEDTLEDDATPVSLDSTFYSSSNLKYNDFFVDLDYDMETDPSIDLLVGTKFWMDNDFASQRLQFLEVSKNIVRSAFKSMPDDELDLLKENFDAMERQVDATQNVLSKIEQGQKESLSALEWKNSINSYYTRPTNRSRSIATELQGIAGTKSNIAQSLHDLYSVRGSTSNGQIRKGKIQTDSYTDSAPSIQSTSPSNLSNSLSRSLSAVYHDFISALETIPNEDGNLPLESSADEKSRKESVLRSSKPLNEMPVFVNSALQFSGKDVFSEDGQLKSWYYDNFAKKILGEDPNFDNLENFLDTFNSVTKDAKDFANKELLSGGPLLVYQAVLKSILKLCQSNIDVSEYAPQMSSGSQRGTSIFDNMGKSAVLGPSKCHQYPSRYGTETSAEEKEYSVENFSKPGFLCYFLLLETFQKIRMASTSRKNYVKSNIKNYNSDHDSVINLWWSMQSSHEGWTQSRNFTTTNSYSHKRSFKEIGFLYKKDEVFNSDYIRLIPTGDQRIPSSERTFFSYNLFCPDHMLEYSLFGNNSSIPDNYEGLKPVSEDFDTLVDSEGRINLFPKPPLAFELMGYQGLSESEWVGSGNSKRTGFKRTKRVHYGVYDTNHWTSNNFLESGESITQRDTFPFWKHKNYNMPYFWAGMMGIQRTVVVEAYKYLLDTISEITGKDIDVSTDYILENFDTSKLYDCILEITRKLIFEGGGNRTKFYGWPDGTLTLTSTLVSNSLTERIHDRNFWNTPGLMTTQMVKAYIKFVSLCSTKNMIEIADDYAELMFDDGSYVSPEVLAKDTNLNFKNGHGGAGSYIAPEFEVYYDPLVFKKEEFLSAEPIKKNTSPIGEINVFNYLYEDFLDSAKILSGHSLFHEKVNNALGNFRKFIEGFQISDTVKEVFQEGHFNAYKDIRNPKTLVEQIENNRKLYEPDETGISKSWDNISLEAFGKTLHTQNDPILYTYILGLKKELWDNPLVDLVVYPEYYGSGGSVEITAATHSFDYFRPSGDSSTWPETERHSKCLLDYFHVVRGIQCDELTFSSKKNLIYNDQIINSESGIFPWVKDDFKEGEPKEDIDPLFNMSPLVFPRNYFYDLCLENEYHRVVAVSIKRSHLEDLPIDTLDEETSIDEIIGSIRWVTEGAK